MQEAICDGESPTSYKTYKTGDCTDPACHDGPGGEGGTGTCFPANAFQFHFVSNAVTTQFELSNGATTTQFESNRYFINPLIYLRIFERHCRNVLGLGSPHVR